MEKMRKILVVALAITITLAASAGIYALGVHLGIFYGGPVQTVEVEGTVAYSETNSTTATWTPELTNIAAGSPWYARFNVTGDGYSGVVTLTWVLQEKVSGVYTDTAYTVSTTVTLSGSPQFVYASAAGSIGTNKNWGIHTTKAATWRVAVSVEKP